MKIKFVKDRFSYKSGDVQEFDEADAKDFMSKGFAEEVKVDELEEVVKGLQDRIEKAANDAAEKAATATVDKINKGISKVQPRIVVGPDRESLDPSSGFKSYGEFLRDVITMNPKNGGRVSEKMAKHVKAAASVVGTEGNAPDGGPTVPVQYASDIFTAFSGNLTNFMDLAFTVPMSTSFTKIPILKKYNRANTTAANGIVANYVAEATLIPPSRLNWEQVSLNLGKEAVLVPVSNELLDDNNVALESVVSRESNYQLTAAVNHGILQGNTTFTGIKGHASTKVVPRATANAANFADVTNMLAGFNFDDANFDTSVWYASPTLLPQIATMTSGNYNVYTPAGGAMDQKFDRLFGRPIIWTGHASALGTAGDLILADMSKYIIGYKGGVNAAVSMHIYFDADETAFRYTLRINGKPGLSGPITLEDGVTTVSPFVVLGDHV